MANLLQISALLSTWLAWLALFRDVRPTDHPAGCLSFLPAADVAATTPRGSFVTSECRLHRLLVVTQRSLVDSHYQVPVRRSYTTDWLGAREPTRSIQQCLQLAAQGCIQGGVQGVRTSALCLGWPFLKRAYSPNVFSWTGCFSIDDFWAKVYPFKLIFVSNST